MTIWQKLATGFRWTRAILTPSEAAWRGAAGALWIAVTLITLTFLVSEVLPDFSLGKLAGFLIAVGSLLLAGLLLRIVLWLLSLLSAHYRKSLFFLLPLLLLLVAPGAGPKGTGIVVVALLLITALLGGGIAVLRQDGWKPREQKVTLTDARHRISALEHQPGGSDALGRTAKPGTGRLSIRRSHFGSGQSR